MIKLKKKIVKKIETDGPIPFREFMSMCLYDPEFGYYKTCTTIGREGDFFTSAHIGNMLGRVLSKRIMDLAPSGGPMNVIEIGGGEGHLAVDVLDALSKENIQLYQRVTYHFVEQNPSVFSGNQKRLKDHVDRMTFYDELDELPQMDSAFIFSNEFFDAFPVHLLTRRKGKLAEIYIGYQHPNYTRVFKPLSAEAWRELDELGITIADECTIEINSDIENIYRILAERIKRFHMITIDYGHTQDLLYHAERKNGTLMGYKNHSAYDNIFQMEGEMDLTSHINFDALIHYGEKHGVLPTYFKNQRSYLMDHGLFDLFRDSEEPSTQEAFQLKTLLLPGAMGDVFKILVQEKSDDDDS